MKMESTLTTTLPCRGVCSTLENHRLEAAYGSGSETVPVPYGSRDPNIFANYVKEGSVPGSSAQRRMRVRPPLWPAPCDRRADDPDGDVWRSDRSVGALEKERKNRKPFKYVAVGHGHSQFTDITMRRAFAVPISEVGHEPRTLRRSRPQGSSLEYRMLHHQ